MDRQRAYTKNFWTTIVVDEHMRVLSINGRAKANPTMLAWLKRCARNRFLLEDRKLTNRKPYPNYTGRYIVVGSKTAIHYYSLLYGTPKTRFKAAMIAQRI